MACQKDGRSVWIGEGCKVWWVARGVGALGSPSGRLLLCLGVLSCWLDMFIRLGLGCSAYGQSVCSVWGGSLRLFVDGWSSSDVSKSPQLVIWEKEMSKRTRFVVLIWSF